MNTVALRISSRSVKKLLEQTIEAIKYKVHLNEVIEATDKLVFQLNDYITVNKPAEKTITLEVDGYLACTIYCGLVMWEVSINGVTPDNNIDFCSILEEWNKQFYKSCMHTMSKTSSNHNNNTSFDSRWNGLSMN
jgi:hypothetical protein